MFVGEAPGREEDIEGRPFVGRSGRLLERMLAAIGLSREAVFISNVLPWRPPANNPPSDVELSTCLPFICRQIELVAPDVVVCLGGASARALLGRAEGIKRVRGRWLTCETDRIAVSAMATLHPAYLLRRPAEKRVAWRDFLMLADRLGLAPPGG
jgi:DNA polymerase